MARSKRLPIKAILEGFVAFYVANVIEVLEYWAMMLADCMLRLNI